MAKPADKRVFELSVRDAQTQAARLLAIGADSTILDLYLAALGAFNWRGDYDAADFDYRVIIDRRVYEHGKGSHTALRRVLDAGTRGVHRVGHASRSRSDQDVRGVLSPALPESTRNRRRCERRLDDVFGYIQPYKMVVAGRTEPTADPGGEPLSSATYTDGTWTGTFSW